MYIYSTVAKVSIFGVNSDFVSQIQHEIQLDSLPVRLGGNYKDEDQYFQFDSLEGGILYTPATYSIPSSPTIANIYTTETIKLFESNDIDNDSETSVISPQHPSSQLHLMDSNDSFTEISSISTMSVPSSPCRSLSDSNTSLITSNNDNIYYNNNMADNIGTNYLLKTHKNRSRRVANTDMKSTKYLMMVSPSPFTSIPSPIKTKILLILSMKMMMMMKIIITLLWNQII